MQATHKSIGKWAAMVFAGTMVLGCTDTSLAPSEGGIEESLLSVAQTSGQLASGTSFSIRGVYVDSTDHKPGRPGGHRPGGKKSKGHTPIDALNLLAPTEELLAIIDAESGGDLRGFRIFGRAGATITHYDANGAQVSLPLAKDGPQGCSFSGNEFPKTDSLLSAIVKTVVDFGSGVTHEHDSISVTRAGRIIITRVGNSQDGLTETIIYEGYKVNGNQIEGIKTRTSTFSKETGEGLSVSNVVDGRITFSDGTVASWTSSRERKSSIVFSENGRPESGSIVTTGSTFIAANGSIIYSHVITKALTEDVSCKRPHRGPVSGTVAVQYLDDEITVDFGDGVCENQTVTVTINGTTTTGTVGD